MNLPKLFAALIIILVVIGVILLLLPIYNAHHPGTFTKNNISDAQKWAVICLGSAVFFIIIVFMYGGESNKVEA